MARTVRDAKLETRAARLRLPPSPNREPYWKSMGQGEALGYYRGSSTAGSWMARWRPPRGTYTKKKLGQADDVRDADGLRVLSYAQAQAAARDWFAEQNRLHAGHDPTPAGPYRVRDAVAEYLAWFTRHRKSVADTARVCERSILPDLGDEEVARLTPARIRAWHEGVAARPRGYRGKGGAEQSAAPIEALSAEAVRARRATANRHLTVLKAALSHAFAEAKIASDAAWRRVKPFRGADAARIAYLTEDECRRLLNACDEDFRRIVRGALETGCRYGELCRATVGDFHPDAPSLLIRDAKSGKPRHVPLDRQAAAFLAAITAGRPATDPVFLRSDGEPWGTSHQARRLDEASRRAGITPAINFHGLRHTWASLRIMKGLPLMVAAQVLGHSTTRMVEKHYGHLARSYVQQAVEATSLELPLEASPVVPMRRR